MLIKARRPRDTRTRQQQGYGAEHQRWRALILARDPVCVHCNAAPSKHADHIRPITRGGARYDLANGQGLCPPCHGRKSVLEGNAFVGGG